MGGMAWIGKAAIASLDALFVVAIVSLWALVPFESAYAYVDPSVMTYTIQALAGLVVALSAVAGVAFRRTRRKVYQVFKIDENANKIAEADVERLDPKAPDAEQRYERAREYAHSVMEDSDVTSEKHSVRNLKWPVRFAFSLLMTLFMAFIVFIAPALEIVGTNSDSLVFTLQSIWWIPTLFCCIAAVIVALLLSQLKGKPFYIALLVVFSLTVAAYVQSLFMNSGMMPADGGFINWFDGFFVVKMVYSTIVWLLIIIVPLVLSRRQRHVWLKGTAAVACAIIVVQFVGVISVVVDSNSKALTEQSKPYVTQGGLLSVSADHNVIEFVLDTYDTAILNEILEEDPNYLDNFTDFTFFRNSSGTMIPTTNAVPNMLTQQKPAPGQDIADYRRTKYEKGTFLGDVKRADYSIGLYTDSLMADYSLPSDLEMAAMTINVHPVNQAPIDVWRTFVATVQCALYREAPWVAKPAFWYYTSDINNRMIADAGYENLDDSLYELNDAAILQMLRSQKLSVANDGKAGAYRFIHLFGPHFPFSVDENGNEIGTNQSDQKAQAKGSMQVVLEYMNQLKELGLYDEATIIVTADHGVWALSDDPVQNPISPIILVKPSKSSGEGGKPAEISEMPVCHDDLQPTVISALNGDYGKYGTPIFDVNDPQRLRYFDALTNAGGQGQRFVEYEISGNALDLANWQKTGNEWWDA